MKSLLMILLVSIVLSAQERSSSEDASKILERIVALEKHSEAPEALLDPELPDSSQTEQLKYLAGKEYHLSITPLGGPRLVDDQRAVLKARIHFKDLHGESDITTEIAFVKRGSQWYFANYDFLGWTIGLVVFIILGSFVGIAFAAMVLILRARLRKAGQLNAKTSALTFFPFAWPSLWKRADQIR
jgi:hypothetical protein